MTIIRQSTARTLLVGPVLDSDGVAKTDEVVANIRITKNGTVGSAHGSTTLTHDHAGKYKLAMDAGDSDTVGVLEISLTSGTNDMPVKALNVVEEAVYDAMYAASAAGPLQSTTAGRKLTVSANGEGNADMTFILGTALTETAGLLAGGFKKFFNVVAPTATALSLPDAVPDAAGGLPISDAGGLDLDNNVLDVLKAAGIVLMSAAIETVNSQTEFVIPATDDATDDDAYNGATAVVIDQSDPNQRAVLLVSDYVASTRAVTLAIAAEFTVLAGDTLVILSGSSTKGVWDRLLSGTTHNIASSAGRRLRGVQAFGDYANGALWFDSATGVGGQVAYENATVQNPSNSLTDVLAIALALNMTRIQVAPGSTLTLNATVAGFTVIGENWTLVLDSQNIAGSFFHGAEVSGISAGAGASFESCHVANISLAPGHFTRCGLEGVVTLLSAGDYFIDGCHGAVLLPAIDYEDAAENKNVYVTGYNGDIEIRNLGQAGSTDTLHLDGDGKLVLASTCEAATIDIQGNIELTDNVAGGFVAGASGTINDEARFEVQQVTGGAYALATNASGNALVKSADDNELAERRNLPKGR